LVPKINIVDRQKFEDDIFFVSFYSIGLERVIASFYNADIRKNTYYTDK